MSEIKNNVLGWFEGRVHFYPIHVFYEDTDFSGLVYHANYLRYFERGRSSFLNLIGVAHSDLWQKQEIAFTIRKFEIDYKAPAKIDDNLLIKTTYDKTTGRGFSSLKNVRRMKYLSRGLSVKRRV